MNTSVEYNQQEQAIGEVTSVSASSPDATLTDLISRIDANTKKDSILQDEARNKINAACDTIVDRMAPQNQANVEYAYLIGTTMLKLRGFLYEDVEGDPRSHKPYNEFMDRLLDEYATRKLANSNWSPDEPAYKIRAQKLRASRRRQITKYINLAECGPAILDLGYGGIEAALEGRYLLIEMQRKSDGRPKMALTPEEASTLLDQIKVRYPYPSPADVAGKDVRDEFRRHTDTIGTLFQLRYAGFTNEDIDLGAAKAYAHARNNALEYVDAKRLFDGLATVPVEQRREKLSEGLLKFIKTGKSKLERPRNISGYIAKIVVWGNNISLNDEVITQVRNLPDIGRRIADAIQVLNNLSAAVSVQEDVRNEELMRSFLG